MSLPSGVNAGLWITWPAGTVSTTRRAPVASVTASISVLPTTKAICLPSGDQAGSYSSTAVSVISEMSAVCRS